MISFKKRFFALTILLLTTIFAYGHTLNHSWHFDDYRNIVNNGNIHIKDLGLSSLVKASHADPKGDDSRMYRPVSCISFALNWFIGGDRVSGYHFVNIIIHLITASFLFSTILNILSFTRVKKKYRENAYFIALTATLLWALSPIQTQAVTYIVQRMCSLSAMFYIAGIYCFIRARLSAETGRRVLFFSACFLCFLFSTGAKENGAMLPASLVLVEVIFFMEPGWLKKNRSFILYSGLAVLALIISTVIILKVDLKGYLSGFTGRPFTLYERLMTEPRVLLFHLGQIFYPVADNLSIHHDITLSTSFFSLWTLPWVLTVAVIIAAAIICRKSFPLFSFAILFFFLNHLIESTVFPLELIFEHRNYLPSLFIFMPVAAGLKRAMDLYRDKSRLIYFLICSSVPVIILSLSLATYTRNRAWASEKTLWEDAMEKAPLSVRPPFMLAQEHYMAKGNWKRAAEFFLKGAALSSMVMKKYPAASLAGAAEIYYQAGEYDRAIVLCKKAYSIYPKEVRPLYITCLIQMRLNIWNKALATADSLILKKPDDRSLYNMKGVILFNLNRPEQAEMYFEKTLEYLPGFRKAALNLATVLISENETERADALISHLEKNGPPDIRIMLLNMGSCIKKEDPAGAKKHAEMVISLYGTRIIERALNGSIEKNSLRPVPLMKIRRIISETYSDTVKIIKNDPGSSPVTSAG